MAFINSYFFHFGINKSCIWPSIHIFLPEGLMKMKRNPKFRQSLNPLQSWIWIKILVDIEEQGILSASFSHWNMFRKMHRLLQCSYCSHRWVWTNTRTLRPINSLLSYSCCSHHLVNSMMSVSCVALTFPCCSAESAIVPRRSEMCDMPGTYFYTVWQVLMLLLICPSIWHRENSCTL